MVWLPFHLNRIARIVRVLTRREAAVAVVALVDLRS